MCITKLPLNSAPIACIVCNCQHVGHICESVYIHETASELCSNHLYCVYAIVNMHGIHMNVYTYTKLPLNADPITCVVCIGLSTCMANMCMYIHVRSCLSSLIQ